MTARIWHGTVVALISAVFLSSCILPKFSTEEEPPCQLWTRKLEISVSSGEGRVIVDAMVSALSHCDTPECLMIVPLAILAIPVSSFIVSGSIVVAGNTVHWIEEQGRCPQSLTQQALRQTANSTKEAGGKVIESGKELIHWFEQQFGSTAKPATQDE